MEQTLEALTQALKTGDYQQRRAIIAELGRRGQEGDLRVIPILICLLYDEGPYADEAASDALQAIGTPAIPALTELLGDQGAPWEARVAAASALVPFDDPRVSTLMVTAVLNGTEHPMLRRVLAMNLGRVRTDEAFDALAAVITDPTIDPMIRAGAAAGFGEMRDPQAFEPLVAVLHQENVRFVTPQVARELQRLRGRQVTTSGPAAEQLADLIKRAESGRSLHDEVVSALRNLRDPRTVDLLLPQLGTDDEERQVAVAAAIGDSGEGAIAPLLVALQSGAGQVRAGAAAALGFAAEPRAVEPLSEVLRHDPGAAARRAAASSLGFIADERVVPALIEGLRDEDVQVRLASAHGLYNRALTGHADIGALPALELAAEHDPGTINGHYAVRDAAARAVREIRLRT